MTAVEKFFVTLTFVFLWVLIGVTTAGFMDLAGVPNMGGQYPSGDAIVVMILWPLFWIKYLLLGLIYLVTHGAAMLFTS